MIGLKRAAVCVFFLIFALLIPGCAARPLTPRSVSLAGERRFTLQCGELACEGILSSPGAGRFILSFTAPEAMREFVFAGTADTVEVTAGTLRHTFPLSDAPPDSPIALVFSALTALEDAPLTAKRGADGAFTLTFEAAGRPVTAKLSADGSPIALHSGDLGIAFRENIE